MKCGRCGHPRAWHDAAGCQWLTLRYVKGCPCSLAGEGSES